MHCMKLLNHQPNSLMVWKQIKFLPLNRYSKPHLLFFCLLILTGFTIRLLLPSSRCTPVTKSHRSIVNTLARLRRQAPATDLNSALPPTPYPPSQNLYPLLKSLSRQSSIFLRLHVQRSKCSIPPVRRNLLEFSLSSRYRIDGVFLYLLSILGSSRKTFVEIDGAHGRGVFGAGVLPSLMYNWTTYVLHESWTAYESARKFYEGSSNVMVIDSQRVLGREFQISTSHLFGGVVDIAASFPAGGDEIALLRTFNQSASWIRPRLLCLFFQDFWWLEYRMRISDMSLRVRGRSDRRDWARERVFVGGSLPVVERSARACGYRLVWCLASVPIAFFVDERAAVGDGVLPTLSSIDCLQVRSNSVWRRDAERMWDEAQSFKWKHG